jgi:hypothetical protein
MSLFLIIAIVFFALFLSGIYQLLLAIWHLREGKDRDSFVKRGMLACGLIIISFLAPYLIMIDEGVYGMSQQGSFLGQGIPSMGSTTGSTQTLPSHP